MSVLVAIDPGLRHCGVAVFRDGLLVGAHLPRSSEKKARGAVAWAAMADAVFRVHPHPPDTLVLEQPQVYGGPRGEDPNDLIELAGVDGAILGRLSPVQAVSYLPRQWKGNIAKDIMLRRILKPERISDLELSNAGLKRDSSVNIGVRHHEIPAHLLGNTVDAIGLGLFHLGRLG